MYDEDVPADFGKSELKASQIGLSKDFPDQHTSGAKLDDGKVDMSLLQLLGNAIHEVCRVMTYGKTKYTRGGFLDVPEAPIRYSAAMLRHYFLEQVEKYDAGDPFYDTELGLPFKGKIRHDAQVAVNALFRLECTLREEEEAEAIIQRANEIETFMESHNYE